MNDNAQVVKKVRGPMRLKKGRYAREREREREGPSCEEGVAGTISGYDCRAGSEGQWKDELKLSENRKSLGLK